MPIQKEPIKIRIALDVDIPKLMELAKAYVSEADRWNFIEFNKVKTIKSAFFAMHDSNQQIFIATRGKEIIGFMWVVLIEPVWSNDKICHDLFLYMKPDERNLASSKKLVAAVEKWAKACSAKAILTGANSGVKDDVAAQAFYKFLGYNKGGNNFYKKIGG